jgi:CRP-like cAMP-binding protein
VEYALLAPLAESDRRRVLAIARRRRFARDDVVFWAGDPGDSLHLLASGHVAAQVTTPRGDIATVRVLGPGEHFGELAIVSPGERSATIRALDEVVTLVLHRDDLEELLRSPAIQSVFVTALALEVRRLSQALADALYLPASDHLWKRLAAVEAVFAGNGAETELPLTQATLATLAGVTRQTANKFFDDAESIGVIRRDGRGRVVVVDRAALRARAETR